MTSSTDTPVPDGPAPGPTGLIGLGNLGAAMAGALLDVGWPLRVYDQRRDRLDASIAAGAAAVTAPVELAECQVVGVVVNDDRAVEDVLVDSGLLARLRPGAVVAVHSTVLPSTAVALGERARKAGVVFVDAPVSGGAERARAGDLTVFLGSAPELPGALTAYLDAIATHVARLGAVGAGAAAKLGNQLIMFAAVAAAYEAVELGAAYGADETALLEAVSSSTGDAWILHHWGFFDRTAADYDTAGLAVRHRPWSKDLWDVVAAARDKDVAVPVAGLLAQLTATRIEAHAAAARGGEE